MTDLKNSNEILGQLFLLKQIIISRKNPIAIGKGVIKQERIEKIEK